MKRIAIHGTGRMAYAIVQAVKDLDNVEIMALAGPQEPEWECPVAWVPSLGELPGKPDFLIESESENPSPVNIKGSFSHRKGFEIVR